LAKRVPFSPSSSARRFIWRTNASRLPETCSASVTAASLADASQQPAQQVGHRHPLAGPQADHGLDGQAAVAPGRHTSDSSARSSTRSAVMSLVVEAIARPVVRALLAQHVAGPRVHHDRRRSGDRLRARGLRRGARTSSAATRSPASRIIRA
jgi:hypothetical protein